MEGNHSHDTKQITNSFNFVSNKKNIVSTLISHKQNSSQISSNIKVLYPGRTVKISNQLIQNDVGESSNTLNIQYQPGKKNVLIMALRKPSNNSIAASLDINISDMKQVRILGEVGMDSINFTGNASLILGKDIYAFRILGRKNGPSGNSFSTYIKWPSRHITLDLDATFDLPVVMGKAEVKWDADKDVTKRLLLDYRATIDSLDSIDAYFNHQSPLGITRLDIKHRGGNIFITNLAVEWGNFHRITVDTTFSHKQNDIAHHVMGKIKITSPFRGYRNIDFNANYQSDTKHILSNIIFIWKPLKPFSIHLKVKKQITWLSFDGSLVINTPLTKFHRTSLEIKGQ